MQTFLEKEQASLNKVCMRRYLPQARPGGKLDTNKADFHGKKALLANTLNLYSNAEYCPYSCDLKYFLLG